MVEWGWRMPVGAAAGAALMVFTSGASWPQTHAPAARQTRIAAPGSPSLASNQDAPATDSRLPPGERLFDGACAGCHGPNAQDLKRAAADAGGAVIITMILHGIGTPMERGFMPSFAQAYSNAEIAAIANYVVLHYGGVRGEVSRREVQVQRAAP
jgi:mono/diheme cytochrome c family protein